MREGAVVWRLTELYEGEQFFLAYDRFMNYIRRGVGWLFFLEITEVYVLADNRLTQIIWGG